VVGIPYANEEGGHISHVSFMGVILTIHVAMILGFILNEAIGKAGLTLPLFSQHPNQDSMSCLRSRATSANRLD